MLRFFIFALVVWITLRVIKKFFILPNDNKSKKVRTDEDAKSVRKKYGDSDIEDADFKDIE